MSRAHGPAPLSMEVTATAATAAAHKTVLRPVRVCFIIDRLSRAGTETQLLALIRTLDRRRVEPFLALLDGEDDLSRALEPSDCPVIRLGIRSLASSKIFARARQFVRFIGSNRIDIVQAYFLDSI